MTLAGWRKWLFAGGAVYLLGRVALLYVTKKQVEWLLLVAGILISASVIRAWRTSRN